MEHQTMVTQKKGRPLPRRGQIKAKIFSSLVGSIIPRAAKKGGEKNGSDGGGGTMPTTPTPSGYNSEDNNDT